MTCTDSHSFRGFVPNGYMAVSDFRRQYPWREKKAVALAPNPATWSRSGSYWVVGGGRSKVS